MTQPELNLSEEVSRAYGEILNTNAGLLSGLRTQATNVEVIREFYLQQADRCTELIHLIASQMIGISQVAGDMLLNEFGLALGDDDDDDEK